MTDRKAELSRIALAWAAGGFALASVLGGVVSAGAQALASHNTQAPPRAGAI